MCVMEKVEPQAAPQNLRSDLHAFSQNSLGGPHSEAGRIYGARCRFRFPFPRNRPLLVARPELAGPGTFRDPRLRPPCPPLPAAGVGALSRTVSDSIRNLRPGADTGESQAGARPPAAPTRPWPAQGPLAPAAASARPELPWRGWG